MSSMKRTTPTPKPGDVARAQNLTSAWNNAAQSMSGFAATCGGSTGGVSYGGGSSGTVTIGSSWPNVTLPATGTSVPQGNFFNTPSSPRPLKAQYCESVGHMMSAEVEWDEFVMGKCENCGEKMMGRRIAGGLAVERLRHLIEGTLNDEKELTELCMDTLRMQQLIDDEERALVEAKSMLTLAREKIRQRAMQPKPFSLKDITAA